MYALRYTIPFVGNEIAEPIRYRVELWQRLEEGSATPEVVELDGAPSPFEFSLANDDDPMLPIRTSTAKISFVDDIDLVELLPADGFEWRVVLMNADDNTAVFTGYLTGEVFTQPFVEGPNIVTVNAVSATVPALATEIPFVDSGSLSLFGFIAAFFECASDLTHIYIPAQYTTSEYIVPEQYLAFLKGVSFSVWNFISRVDNPQITGKEYEFDYFTDVWEAILKLLGWSFVDVGDGSLYLASAGYVGDYMQISREQIANGGYFAPTLIATELLPFQDIEPVDKSDTMEVRRGYDAISIEIEVNDTTSVMPSIDSQVEGWKFERYDKEVEAVRHGGEGTTDDFLEYGVAIAKKTPTLKVGDIELHCYRPSWAFNADGVPVATSWQHISPNEAIDVEDVVSRYIDEDSCLDVEKGNRKEWSFKQFYRFQEWARYHLAFNSIQSLPEDYPLLTVRGFVGMNDEAMLNFNCEMRAVPVEGLHIPSDFLIAPAVLDSGAVVDGFWGVVEENNTHLSSEFWGKKMLISASLKVGDLWWNGESWTFEKSKFEIEIDTTRAEWHPVVTNKTLDMPYSGSSGLYIPLNGEGGAFEFNIYPELRKITERSDEEYSSPPIEGLASTIVDMRGVSLTLIPKLDYTEGDSSNNEIYKSFARNVKGKREISLPLHSQIDGVVAKSVLFSDARPLRNVWRAGKNKKLEEMLLDDNERIFTTTLRRWRRGLALKAIRPINGWAQSAGRIMVTTGATINYAEGVGEVYLTEIKSM